MLFLPFSLPSASSLRKVPNQPNNGNEMESKGVQFPSRGAPNKIRPTLNSIRQTDVDTLVIRTQSRVRVRVRYLNQTGIRHQSLGGVGVRVMHSR